MSSNFGYIDIILLAMIAGFIILRLRSILGRKTGHEDKIYPRFSEKNFEEFRKQKDINIKKKTFNELEAEEKQNFIKGAEIAYETIITAFAKGDKKSLKSLLGKSIDEMELSVRSHHCLQAAGIKTIGSLVSKDEGEMLKFKNFGRKSLMELHEKLSELELSFGMDISQYVDSE